MMFESPEKIFSRTANRQQDLGKRGTKSKRQRCTTFIDTLLTCANNKQDPSISRLKMPFNHDHPDEKRTESVTHRT